MRRNVFIILWFCTTAGFGWLIAKRYHTFDSPAALPVLLGLLICTIALYVWLPNPVSKQAPSAAVSRRGWFVLLAVLLIGLLFLTPTIIGPSLLFAWPVVAIAVLLYLKPDLSRKELGYALVLSAATSVAALGAAWIPFHPVVWAALQIGIVLPGLLAGWKVLQLSGLWQEGVGRSRLLEQGIVPALRSVLTGIILAMPWALGIVLIGGADSEKWVQNWWQPLVAINPGISEEVWGRILPVSLMFLLLRKVSRPRTAYLVAVLVINYWFAYLHTPGGLSGAFSTILIGTLFNLPLSFVCLHRDLETAIGFHFWADFVKFLAALFLNRGIWFV